MVYIDWNTIMAVTPDTFTEDEKEDLVETIVWYTPPSDVNRDQLVQLIKVFQEILKYKIDQVESLMGALDELAGKQGEEVARARQELMDEVDDLREQLEYYRRMDTSSGASDEQLRSEVVRLEMQNEELLQVLQERDKDLVSEKSEAEKLVGDVARLEREKMEISRELAALQEEADSRYRRGNVDSPDEPEKLEHYVQLVRQKNKHIMQLLEDIEAVEQDNQSIKLKHANTRDQLKEANELATQLTNKVAVMQVALDDSERKIGELTDHNRALASQVDELMAKKAKHDHDLDEFAVTLNSRVEEWQRLIDAKDAEIIAVREELEKYVSTSVPWSSTVSDPELKAKFLEQESEIVRVKKELLEMSKEKAKQEVVIMQLKEKVSKQTTDPGNLSRIKQLEEEKENLLALLKSAEDDSTLRAEEISKLVVQVRAYEREEFGLTEAIDQLKKMEKRVKEKEIKVEELIKACNMLEIEKGELEDENIYLRDKLGLSPTHQVDSSSVRKRFAADAATIDRLKEELEKIREEILNLKLKNRQLLNQVKDFSKKESNQNVEKIVPVAINLDKDYSNEIKTLEAKYMAVVEENDGLRKGLHEILEGIQKNTLGAVEVKSVERLLEALDARHVSGWYHPAMRLQAQVNTLKGEAKELRNQLRDLNEKNCLLLEERRGSGRIDLIDNKNNYEADGPVGVKNYGDTTDFEEKCVLLELELTNLRLDYNKAAADWENERNKLVRERDGYLQQVTSEVKPNAMKELILGRERIWEAECANLRNSLFNSQEKFVSKITQLHGEKLQLLHRIKNIEGVKTEECKSELNKDITEELIQLRIKMSEIVNMASTTGQKNSLESHDCNFHESEKEKLMRDLKEVKTKLVETEALLNACEKNDVTPDAFNNQLSHLAKQLAESEVRMSSENLKRKHYESINEFLKAERSLLENQIQDLTIQVSKLTEINGKLQVVLSEVKEELQLSNLEVKGSERESDQELTFEKLISEKSNLEELLTISRNQCKSLEMVLESQSMDKDSLAECLALLQSPVGEKEAVALLSQQLLEARNKLLSIQTKNAELDGVVASLTASNLEKEREYLLARNELSDFKASLSAKFKLLHKFLYTVHSAYQGAILYPSIDSAHNLVNIIKTKKSELEDRSKVVEVQEKEVKIREKDFEVQLEALQDLKAAFKGDSTNLVNWHNKSTELRLRENRLKRENDQLLEQVQQLKNDLRRSNEEMVLMEERSIKIEGELETRQLLWEKYQFELCCLLGNGSFTQESKPDKKQEELDNLQKEIDLLKLDNQRLVTEMSQKEAVFTEKLKERLSRGKSIELEEAGREPTELAPLRPRENSVVEPERVALQITVDSLQSILKQKEDTISRYQETLKKTREEHGVSMRRLQGELRNVHNALAKQSKAYSRLQHGVYQSPTSNGFEKLVTKVHELEEELNEAQSNYSRVQAQLKIAEQEAEKWRDVAEERMALVEETRERMDMEVDHYREELHLCQTEAREFRDGPHVRNLIDAIQDLQRKLVLYGERTNRPLSGKSTKEAIFREKETDSVEVEHVKRQLKSSREECARLREQLRILKEIKRRPSEKTKPNQDHLVDKIRELEEMLKLSKQHERELEESGLKKMRSVEEVTRWDERKRFQKTLETLNTKLKQKEVESTVAVNKMETMRHLMGKLEREKAFLESQVKNLTESARESSRMQLIKEEKAVLVSQVAALEGELSALRRFNQPSQALYLQLEEQEKKIAVLQLAAQAPSTVASEVERLRTTISSLERDNVALESENLKLKLVLEQLREENELLRHSPKKPVKSSPSRTETRFAYEAQREVNKLKIDVKSTRERLSEASTRNQELEEEVQRLRNQLQLWEDKDMATSLSKSSDQKMSAELHRELLQVKAQLTHKMYLLDKVKILLKKAAAKERALNEKVEALQTIVDARDG